MVGKCANEKWMAKKNHLLFSASDAVGNVLQTDIAAMFMDPIQLKNAKFNSSDCQSPPQLYYKLLWRVLRDPTNKSIYVGTILRMCEEGTNIEKIWIPNENLETK